MIELELKQICSFYLALMRGLAIHFRPRQMRNQFSWTLSKTILQLGVVLPNTIPSYPSPLPLPIVHLCCFMVHEHHQIKNQKSPLTPTPFDSTPTPSKKPFSSRSASRGHGTLLPTKKKKKKLRLAKHRRLLDNAHHNTA